MAVSVRIKPLSREALFRPGGVLSPTAGAQLVAAYAREQIAIADNSNADTIGKTVPHETFVNDTASDNLESVQPGKSIVATWQLGSDVVKFVYDLIVTNSPRLTGAYSKSHRIFSDGHEVDAPEEAVGAAEVVILSIAPYARKIEGAGGKKPQSSQSPDGVYQAAATIAHSRYGNIANIKYTMQQPILAGELTDWASRHSAKQSTITRQRRQFAKDTWQPAIVISFR
jgi:hypothetical protein